MTQVRTRITMAFLALTVLLAGLPNVAAQQLSANVQDSDKEMGQIQPEIGQETIQLAYTYAFTQPFGPAFGVGKTQLTATLEVTCGDAENIIVTGPRTQSVDVNPTTEPQGSADNQEFVFELQVSVTRQLQGLKRHQCDTTASVDALSADGTAAGESNEVSDIFTVTASYYGLIQSSVTGQIKKTGPQKEITFPIALDNFGNARTRIQFEIIERPGGKKWSAVTPDDVILDSPYDGGPKTSDTAEFQVTTTYKNGWNNEQGTYTLGMKIFAADDPQQTAPDLKANVLIRVRGVYVPTLEPMLLLGAMLASAFIVRAKME